LGETTPRYATLCHFALYSLYKTFFVVLGAYFRCNLSNIKIYSILQKYKSCSIGF